MNLGDSREGALREEILRLRAALAQAERDATLDPLTGCLNRRGWAQRLAAEERRCRRHGLDAVVAIVDLDGLKATNDDLGHAAGDKRLKACGDALRAALRSEDVVARLGGDEFAVLAVHTAPGAPDAVIAHVARAFDEADVQASVGWALRSGHRDLSHAVTAADRHMLAVKAERAGAR